jgi:hypothetical protein
LWSGLDCSVRECIGGCSGRGTCLNGTCICDAGWSSSDCSSFASASIANNVDGQNVLNGSFSSLCPKNCSGFGSCENGMCVCDFGRYGDACDRYFSDPLDCSARCLNNGTCLNSTCLCAPGYSGARCQTNLLLCPNGTCTSQCPDSCNGNGRCIISQRGISACLCNAGFHVTGVPASTIAVKTVFVSTAPAYVTQDSRGSIVL